jgi:peptidoglycan/xylan/chitin deacetylase (PgdA/CDA1 family)
MTRVAATTFDEQVTAYREGRHLRVVNYHNTPAAQRDEIRRELTSYARRYTCVLPEHLDAFYATGHWPLDRPGFIPVFYDGYRNNATVAAPLCDELGITAWFFPPTGFIDTPVADQRAYAGAHNITLVESEREQDQLAMTWDDLAWIAQRHVVAAHTSSHARAADLRTAAAVEEEATAPAQKILQVTGRPAAAFAWLGGTPFEPDLPGNAALRDLGIPYCFSNTKVQRIQ